MGGIFTLGTKDSNQTGALLRLDCSNVQLTTVGMLCFPYQEENVLVFTEESDEIDKFPSNWGI